MRRWGGAGAVMLPCLVLAGCVLEDVDLTGKHCPCGPGYSCDERRDECVPGRLDGGEVDGAARDGGLTDGPGEDAGPADAGPVDSGGLDAGTPDGGRDAGSAPIDGGPDPTACDDLLAGASFCDGFEDPELVAWPDRYGTGSLARSTTGVYRGLGALSVSTAAGNIRAVEVFGLSGLETDVWIRGYVFVSSGFDLVDVGMMYAGAGSLGMGLGVEAGGLPYLYVDESRIAVAGTTVTVPRDRWTCLRAHVVVSDTAGIVEIWVDDTLAARRTGIDTRASLPYTSFAAGITYSNPAGGSPDVLLDEVAIGGAPLPCD